MITVKTVNKPGKIDTAWIRTQLANLYPGTVAAKWKRTSKKNIADDVVRTFIHPGKPTIVVTELLGILSPVQFSEQPDGDNRLMEEQVIAAAKTIKHCGDYGRLHVNHNDKEIWWCAGDGDCSTEQGHTGYEEIKLLLKVPGVKVVHLEAECEPDENDTEWKYLGTFGITV
jgi:hypothetical protein